MNVQGRRRPFKDKPKASNNSQDYPAGLPPLLGLGRISTHCPDSSPCARTIYARQPVSTRARDVFAQGQLSGIKPHATRLSDPLHRTGISPAERGAVAELGSLATIGPDQGDGAVSVAARTVSHCSSQRPCVEPAGAERHAQRGQGPPACKNPPGLGAT